MDVNNYEWIEFEHEPTGHIGKLRVGYKTKWCNYFYRDAEPLWYMDITKDEANEHFAKGEWLVVDSRKLNEYLITK